MVTSGVATRAESKGPEYKCDFPTKLVSNLEPTVLWALLLAKSVSFKIHSLFMLLGNCHLSRFALLVLLNDIILTNVLKFCVHPLSSINFKKKYFKSLSLLEYSLHLITLSFRALYCTCGCFQPANSLFIRAFLFFISE